MATVTLQFDTGSTTLAAFNNALAREWNYPATVPDPQNPGQQMPNPQSKADYNREFVRRFLKSAYMSGTRKILEDAITPPPDIILT